MKNLKIKPFTMILVLIVVVIIISYFNFERSQSKSKVPAEFMRLKKEYELNMSIPVFKGEKMVHLDLKGAPPKIAYFRKIFPLFSKLGATGLLIEYEDMFPYTGNLKYIPAFNAYTMEQIKEINKLAEQNNLTIIPLVQTFGHMEFVLKLSKYRDLREVLLYPQVICPTNNKSLPLIFEMVRQLIAAHPKSKHIHIGCDEVYHIGTCDKCINMMHKREWTPFRLFLNHVAQIAQYIHSKHNLDVLIWDDMLRNMNEDELKASKISTLVVPVVWKYVPEVYDYLDSLLFIKYSNVFPKLWIASAFKGATGSNQIITDSVYHLENHKSWMRIVTEHELEIKFQGILITGWQRYDHFAVLCELLPVAIPTLALCLNQLAGHHAVITDPPDDITNLLSCGKAYESDYGGLKCSYPGAELLDVVYNLKKLREKYNAFLDDSRIKGWMNDFNVKYGFSNPELIDSGTRSLDTIRMELSQLEIMLNRYMSDIYDGYTIDEWKETHLRPLEAQLINMWEKREKLLFTDVWPNRPININGSLKLP